MRRYLLQQQPFAVLGGEQTAAPGAFDLTACIQTLGEALREANQQIYAAAREPGGGKRGMGCTAEVVCVDGRNVVVGYVGDSRTYHLQAGTLTQLTRDQTLANHLLDLGELTPEEALLHPRGSELYQALGARPTVTPGFAYRALKPGDWLVVCSDGVTNHIPPELLQETLQIAASAGTAARRLVNLVNLHGATDNATVIVVRAM
jgi:PPM family protein phosphatase